MTGSSKKRRHFLRALLIAVVVLVACVLLIPVVLSSGWARVRILSAVNEQIEGTVAIADWRVSLFGSMDASGIRYHDPAGHDVAVRKVNVPCGLLALIRTRDLGTVLVQEPRVRIVPPPPVEKSEKKQSKALRPSASSKPVDIESGSKTGLEFPAIPLKGILKLQNAAVDVVNGDTFQTLLQDMAVTVDFSELPGPLVWTLSTESGVSSGSMVGNGVVELVPGEELNPLTLPMHAELRLTALELSPVFVLLGSDSELPSGDGELSVSLSVKGNPLHVQGSAEIVDLQLQGGVLGKDKPSFDEITLDFAGTYTLDGPVLDRFHVTSPVVNVTATGHQESMTVRAIAKVPELFSRFPHMLRLREDMTVKRGTVDIRTALRFSENSQAMDATVALQGVEGMLDGKRVALDEDVTLRAKMRLQDGDIHIENFTVKAGFMRGRASGSLEQLDARFEADIPKAMRETGKFVDLGRWRAAGTATLAATIRPTEDRQVVSAQFSVRDLSVAEGDRVVYADPSVNVSLDAVLDAARDDPRLQVGKLLFSSAPLSLNVKGVLENINTSRDLTLDGTVLTDMNRVEEWVTGATDMDLHMEGKQEKPLHLQMSLGDKTSKEILHTMLAEAGLYADRVQILGLDLTNVEAPLAFSNGVSRLDLTTQWNRGRIELRPCVNWNEESPTIVFPPEAKVIDGVTLTDALADLLLARISPVFKGAVVMGGSVSMTLDTFRFPLDEDQLEEAAFSGTFALRDVKLGAGGLLQELQKLMKVDEKVVDMGDRDITFVCEKGRVRTSPLVLPIDGHEVALVGSVGFDQTLRYKVNVPLTEALVGSDVVKVMGDDFVVTLPITGHLTKPKIDRTALKRELVRLGRRAAREALTEKLNESLFGKPDKTSVDAPKVQPEDDKPLSSEDRLKRELEDVAGDLLKNLLGD